MTDHIAEALDRLVPEFDSVDADWQGILTAASPAAVAPAGGHRTLAPRLVWARVRSARRRVRIAIAFAVLSYQTWHKQPSNIPSATGAKRPVVLGKISYV